MLGARLGIDLEYLTYGSFWLVLRHAGKAVILLVLAVAFANSLQPEAYGMYQYLLAAAALLAIPTLTNLDSAVTQAVAAGKEETLRKALFIKMRFGLLTSLGALVGALYYYLNANETLALGFVLIALFVPTMEAYGLYNALPSGRRDFRLGSVMQVLLQLGAAAASLMALYLTHSILVLVAVYFASWTLVRFLAWQYVRAHYGAPQSGVDEKTLVLGKHLSVMGILGTVAQYVDRIILFQTIGGAHVALYSIALAMPDQLKGVFKNTFELVLPRFSTYTGDEIRSSIWRKWILMSLAILAASFLYVLAAPYLFELLFPRYTEGVIYSQIFAVSLVTVATGIFTVALQALHKTRELYLINTLTAVAQIALVVLGVWYLGLWGAVLGRVTARFVGSMLAIFFYVRS